MSNPNGTVEPVGVEPGGQSGDVAGDVAGAFDELLVWAGELPPAQGLALLARWRDQIDVCRSRIVGVQQAAGVSDRAVDGLLGRSATSRGERRRVRQRAETLARNDELGELVNAGALSTEQLDAVADADAKTNGKAAANADLLEQVTAAGPDGARRSANRWVGEQLSNADLEERRRDQRRRREARKTQTPDGLASVTIAGDDEVVAEMWSAIVAGADRLYDSDGGRDVARGKHPRTGDQRLFDAAHALLTASDPKGGGRASTIVVTAERIAGDRDAPPAELIGVGPIPDSLLRELACRSEFVGLLFDGDGEVLWQGRGRRYPTRAQMLALIARDKGCVLCGADPNRCHAHHLMPWSAPGKGRTDIDQMALVCQFHHRDLHERNLTLYRDRIDGRWKLRPATADETPRPRPVTARPKQGRRFDQ